MWLKQPQNIATKYHCAIVHRDFLQSTIKPSWIQDWAFKRSLLTSHSLVHEPFIIQHWTARPQMLTGIYMQDCCCDFRCKAIIWVRPRYIYILMFVSLSVEVWDSSLLCWACLIVWLKLCTFQKMKTTALADRLFYICAVNIYMHTSKFEAFQRCTDVRYYPLIRKNSQWWLIVNDSWWSDCTAKQHQ